MVEASKRWHFTVPGRNVFSSFGFEAALGATWDVPLHGSMYHGTLVLLAYACIIY